MLFRSALLPEISRELLLFPGLQGYDRQFFNASVQFANMDHLMGYINKHIPQSGVLMVYATLGEYSNSVLEHETVQVRDHRDFLPYSSGMSLWGLRW